MCVQSVVFRQRGSLPQRQRLESQRILTPPPQIPSNNGCLTETFRTAGTAEPGQCIALYIIRRIHRYTRINI